MHLEWKPFLDGRVAVAGEQHGQVCLFFDGGQGGRSDSYSCRMTPAEARVLAILLLGALEAPGRELAGGRLVLKCNVGQSVHIGHDIQVHVVDVNDRRPGPGKVDTVRLSFTAPPPVGIYRAKVFERMAAAAAQERSRS